VGSELVTVRRISLAVSDIEAYHAPPLTLTDDYNMRPIFQAGMLAGPKLEIVHKTTKTMGHDPTKAMAPDQNLRISRVVTSPTRIRSIQ